MLFITIDNPAEITNMIHAEDHIRSVARAHFGTDTIDVYHQLIARRNGTEDAFLERKNRVLEAFARGSSQFMREYCAANFSRFAHCRMYKILMGEVERDERAYHYQPRPF